MNIKINYENNGNGETLSACVNDATTTEIIASLGSMCISILERVKGSKKENLKKLALSLMVFADCFEGVDHA